MKTALKILGVLIVLILLGYVLGPKSSFDKVNSNKATLDQQISDLPAYVSEMESKVDGIKPNNQSQFIWVDSLKKTPYSFVYLHGFSASHGEGQPIISNLAERYGANTYLPRLHLHGLEDVDALELMTPTSLMNSAKEAIAIAKTIGEEVIVVGTSTGATLGSYLATTDEDISALILTSPNFDLYDKSSRLITGPWGKALLKQVSGGNYREWETTQEAMQYWTTKNHINGHIALRDLLNQTMTAETFSKIEIPVYIAYYPKDDVISVEAISDFTSEISTPSDKIRSIGFDSASRHVISSKYMNDNWLEVQESIFKYCDEVLALDLSETAIQSDILD